MSTAAYFVKHWIQSDRLARQNGNGMTVLFCGPNPATYYDDIVFSPVDRNPEFKRDCETVTLLRQKKYVHGFGPLRGEK